MATGLVVLALGFVLLLVNLINPVTRYVDGGGLIKTQGPSTGAIVLLIAGVLLAGIGFARRLLAAAENR